ncbi:MAG: diaminopimelate decarboxylase [Oscillospiraceae bacterium]|jgi:diaminopimelate decarboxylase|nr:diaminopimelate decarboxylase [Oscillospiraceae bacterium]
MFVSDCLQINESGHLTIGGMDTVALAEQFGTPAYIMDENQLRQNCREYLRSIEQFYGGHGLPLYASKACCCTEICRIMAEEGMGLDVCSGGEIFTALRAGFPPERMYFHGNNKTPAEIDYAVRENIGHFVVDNLEELRGLGAVAVAQGRRVRILLRVKPGIDAHTHDFIKTGQIDSKFGFALETGEALLAAEAALQIPHLELCGIHCHIGSQIFDAAPFELAAEVMLGFLAQIKERFGAELGVLNLGGGFGICYDEDDQPLPYAAYIEEVSKVVKATAARLGLAMPYIIVEPGRSIPGSTGVTLYRVGAVKEIPSVRTYVLIDGGMCDNPRYILYGAKYRVLCANKAADPADQMVTVAGRCCESGDLIQEFTRLPAVKPGDVLAVLSTGAYNYAMASHYNRIPNAPVILVRDGIPRVAVRRENYEDLCRNDL